MDCATEMHMAGPTATDIACPTVLDKACTTGNLLRVKISWRLKNSDNDIHRSSARRCHVMERSLKIVKKNSGFANKDKTKYQISV